MARTSKSKAFRRRAPATLPRAPGPPTALPQAPAPAERWRMVALLMVVALGAAVRLRQLRHGLPDFVEEAIPFRRALGMWGVDGSRIDWNPQFFHYPSLTLYLHLLLQKLHYGAGRLLGEFSNPADYLVGFQIDPTPMVTLARLVGVCADLVTIVCAARIGERLRPGAGLVAAVLVACSPTLIESSRTIYADTVMVAFALAALERLLAYRAHGGRGRLLATIVLIGLAAGSKYPAIVLLLALGWVLWERHRARGVGRWVASAAAVVAVALVTTPFALLDFETFRRDFEFVGRLGAEGTLGNLANSGFTYHARHLTRDLGWLGLAFLLLSFAFTARHLVRRGEAVTLWLGLLAFGIPISLAHVLAERYLNPVIPLAAALAAATAIELAGRIPGRGRMLATAAALVALGVPSLVLGVRAASRVPGSAESEARRWCEAHLTLDDLLIREQYGAPILSRLDWNAFQEEARFRAASGAAQRRYRAVRHFSVVTLPLSVVGRADVPVRTIQGERVRLSVFPHVADNNRIAYDPRLFAGVDYVLTSNAVRGRFEADPARYAIENRLYALLDSTAEVAASFGPRVAGGQRAIVLYRLGPRAHAAIDAFGPLDPLWWASYIPRSYREQAESLLVEPPDRTGGRTLGPDGEPAAWVRTLTPMFQARFRPLAVAMTFELMEHGRPDLARPFARSILEMDPDNEWACGIYADASQAVDAWQDARAALERTLRSMARSGRTSPALVLEYSDVLGHQGQLHEARLALESLLAQPDANLAGEARRRLEDPSGPFARAR